MKNNKTTIDWHPATESPGKRRVIMAFTKKDLKPGQYLFAPVRYFEKGAIPAEGEFRSEKGEKQLPVAWCYYDEAINGITQQMVRSAEAYAWGWWPDDNTIEKMKSYDSRRIEKDDQDIK